MYIYIYNYIIRFLSGAIMDISRLTNHFVVNFSPSSRWIPKGKHSLTLIWVSKESNPFIYFKLAAFAGSFILVCTCSYIYVCICFLEHCCCFFFGSQRVAILIFALFNKQLTTSRSQFVTHFASSCSKCVNVTSQNPQHRSTLPPATHRLSTFPAHSHPTVRGVFALLLSAKLVICNFSVFSPTFMFICTHSQM